MLSVVVSIHYNQQAALRFPYQPSDEWMVSLPEFATDLTHLLDGIKVLSLKVLSIALKVQ